MLIAGEFYDDEQAYLQLIKENNIEDAVYLRTAFIADSEVKNYLCAADAVIQPYRAATQSGVTPLAYHFEKPMLVTNVGGLPDMVPHNRSGVVTEPEAHAIAAGIMELYSKGETHFLTGLREEKQKYSWQLLVQKILRLAFLPSQP